MSIWKTIGKTIGSVAPLLGTIVGGPAGTLVGGLIGSALGVDGNDPAAVQVAIQDPARLARLKELELNNKAHLETLAIQAESMKISEINKTMRDEIASTDSYVRRWRPTFGYVVSAAWLIQISGSTATLIYAVFSSPGKAANIISMVATFNGSTSVLWAIALSVLGINVVKRSQDKEISAGGAATGILQGFSQLIRGTDK